MYKTQYMKYVVSRQEINFYVSTIILESISTRLLKLFFFDERVSFVYTFFDKRKKQKHEQQMVFVDNKWYLLTFSLRCVWCFRP